MFIFFHASVRQRPHNGASEPRVIMGLCTDILLIILAIIFPPAAVLVRTGCSMALLINVLLTLLGWLPGFVQRSKRICYTPLVVDSSL
jgi:uncharacterized membrane protein YqaE (UPF0057 family)